MQSVRSLLWIILDIMGYQTICYSSERGTHSDRNSGPDLCPGGFRVQTLTRIRMHGAFSAIAERLVLLILTTKGIRPRLLRQLLFTFCNALFLLCECERNLTFWCISDDKLLQP